MMEILIVIVVSVLALVIGDDWGFAAAYVAIAGCVGSIFWKAYKIQRERAGR